MASLPRNTKPPHEVCEECAGLLFSEEMADKVPLLSFCACGTAHKIIKPCLFVDEDDEDERRHF